MVREFVLNAIDSVNDESEQIQEAVVEMSKRTDGLQWTNQDHRIVLHLLDNGILKLRMLDWRLIWGGLEIWFRSWKSVM